LLIPDWSRREEKRWILSVLLARFDHRFRRGTIRDLLLNRRPLYWIEHYEYTVYFRAFGHCPVAFSVQPPGFH
jgi:uncharacterized membrane protein YeiH